MGWGFNTTGPDQAMIVSGRGTPKVVVGGRTFVMPIIQRLQRLSLGVMTLTPVTTGVYTKEGVAVNVDGVAQIKVRHTEEAIRVAAQQFLGKRREEIETIALQTIEGHQRAILGTLTVEQIYQDRVAFAKEVTEVATTDMANMGLEIVSFTIKEVADDRGYLDALGVKRTAEVKRDATIGQAEAARDSEIKSAAAEQEGKAARYKANTAIAESERGYSVEKAKYDQEVNARKAEAELAYQLQETKTKQQIREEEIQIEVVERRKRIEVQEQEAKRMERELEATIRKPAEAERYRLETIAQGERSRILAQAEAEAEAIRMRGTAEADAMKLKAEAWKEYGQAAVIQQLLETLPDIAAAVAQPLSKVDRIVVIGGGGGDGGGTGASRITRDVTKTIAELPEVVEALTGIDILGTLKGLRGIKTTNEPKGQEAPQATSPESGPAAEEQTDELKG